ncbi:MAG TPA: hypothetical protein VFL64_17610 [Rhizobacter sp.]|nr:hypothetical protein [Rhizobacter sp.]
MQPFRLRLLLVIGLLAATSATAAPPADFTGLWEDCGSVPGLCYGYRLTQEGSRVCGSLSSVPVSGEGPRKHGHIRGVVRDSLLTQVWGCGVETRSPCPSILATNRRGLLRCGDGLFETGGRSYTCEEWAALKLPSQYQRVSAEAFAQRFGPAEASLCEMPVTAEKDAPPPVKQ